MRELLSAEQAIVELAKGPPTDSHSLDRMIDRVRNELAELRGE